jgi:2-hydroxycyclohexanecarboxyl-CoA dehydrogenase
MDLGFKDKVVLITGGGSGMGQDMAIAFAREGARVAVNDVNAKGIEDTIGRITAAGGEAMSAQCDITTLSSVNSMVEAVEARYGRIDVLVNNAAILVAHMLFLETKPEDCEKEIRVILFGTMNCARAILPGMISRNYGKIINIVTDAARVGQEREVSYSSAKGGVVSFTKSIAREVGRHNINVNAVSPAATNSPMRLAAVAKLKEKMGEQKVLEREEKIKRNYPLRRIGEQEDVTNAVLFLASDAARHVTGQILSVNGGYAMPG